MTFKLGQSGNPGGSYKLKHLTNDLRKVVAQNPDKVRKISEHIIDSAEKGDLAYIQFLYERLDGKAAQTIEIDQNVNVSLDERLARIRDLKTRNRNATDLTPLLPSPDDD